MTPSPYDIVAQATATLLNPAASNDDLRASLARMYEVFVAATGLDTETSRPEVDHGIWLTTGLALGPRDSARCFFDLIRTTQYLRGAHAAVQALAYRYPGQPIQAIYAGTGPYAPLLLPLATVFPPEVLQITLLEINPVAREAVGRVVDALGVAGHVRAIVQEDATQYRHPSELPLHLFVSECMQKALTKEPQVSIAANLVLQLVPDGVMIPEEVVVKAVLIDPPQVLGTVSPAPRGTAEPKAPRIELGDVFRLNLETAREAPTRQKAVNEAWRMLPAETVAAPSTPFDGYQLVLATTIRTYGDFVIEEFQSGLTHPAALIHDVPSFKPGDRLAFSYLVGPEPVWRFQVVA